MYKVYFSDIQSNIKKTLDEAKQSVHIALAWFTNESLFDLLLTLLSKGIEVKIILMYDEINCHPKSLEFNKFIDNGGHLYFVNNKMMHNKFCVIDSNTVITGSYNWTYSAENYNAENIIVLDDAQIAEQFEIQFTQLKNDSRQEYNYQPIDANLISKEKNTIIEKETELKLYSKMSMNTVQPPELTKNANHHKVRLCHFSIGTIFRGTLKGKKYVHVKYCNSNRPDYWVDIIDDEFVNDVRQYFHISEGGLVENNKPLMPIPQEIYDFKKYKFKTVVCSFEKDEHHKLSTDQDSIIGKNNIAYKYKKFLTLVRYNETMTGYAIYKSMHDACRVICRSLFDKDASNDIQSVYDLTDKANCIFRPTNEDDFWYIQPLYSRFYGYKRMDNIVRSRLQTTPSWYWIDKSQKQGTLSVLYGVYSDDKISISIQPTYAKWFIIEELLIDNTFYNPQPLVLEVIKDLKIEGRKGIVINNERIKQITDWSKFGFKQSMISPDNLILEF